jgi:peptide subunit release factor 1 (eRF1)
VVDELAKIASSEDLEFVVIAGDVRAIQFIKEHLPQELASTSFELATEPHRLEDIREELDKTAAAWVGQSVEETLAKFQEERGQNDLAVDGKQATFEALRKAQVDRLLISPGRVDDVAYFSRSDLTQASLDRKQLAELNMTDIEEADAADVLVRAAIGTGARVVVIPELGKQHGPAEGVGALLRYAG